MRIEILSIFPELFAGFLDSSLIKKARDRRIIQIECADIRSFAPAPHHQVDDVPYGGGAGMVMKPEPLVAAIEDAAARLPRARRILLSAAGPLFNQAKAEELSRLEQMILVCGRYEGVDQRVVDLAIDEQLSIGDYVLMGGEIAAMAVIEAAARLIPGVVGNTQSLEHESFSPGADEIKMLEAPQYTRPQEFRGRTVPEVLLSGNHGRIAAWRHEQSVEITRRNRPDLAGHLKPQPGRR